MNRSDLWHLPARYGHHCFGCSPANKAGLKMSFYTDGDALFSWVTIPKHLTGWRDLAHGGVITTVLDEIMGWTAIYLLKSMVLTKSITVDFLKPVQIGQELRAEGKHFARPHQREVLMEGLLYNRHDILCAKAKGTFAVFKLEAAEKLGMLDDITREFLERMDEQRPKG